MKGHGGDIRQLAFLAGCDPSQLIDFSANINPLGPPPSLRQSISEAMEQIIHYPEPHAATLVAALARLHGRGPDEVVAGNGSSELLLLLPRIAGSKRLLVPAPAYIDYRRAGELAGCEVVTIPLDPGRGFRPDCDQLAGLCQPGDLLVLGQPANPTGVACAREELLALARSCPETVLLIDEAFAGFLPGYQSLAGCAPNIIVLRSLTKLYAMPGLRLGYLVARPAFCQALREQRCPWSVNSLAQAAGLAMLTDTGYLEKSQRVVSDNREQLAEGLGRLPGITVYPGTANYLFLHLDHPRLSGPLLTGELLLRHRIAVRDCSNYEGLEEAERYLRVAVRREAENRRLLEALAGILCPANRPRPSATIRRARPLMLLGTGSDAGKSVLAAGLCRILLQEGLRVAPFKAQNMSLNSFVTRDGGEMGRAQVVQAQACRLDPEVRMNPVLLKPNSDMGSQVIVLGRPVGNMKVREYVGFKEQLWGQVCGAYDSLAGEFDAIVLEGAGSPGEINLKKHDIVNMRMAGHAKAPVLLVGDIDRGGVYASFIGHVAVMESWERQLLAGFVVNRFRGDASLLAEAHAMVELATGRPVLGTVPHISQLGLPQEDSVSFKAGCYQRERNSGRELDIVLIDLPHISNFTDAEPLLIEPDVGLRLVRRGDELGQPDAVILPGSKNVPADLAALEKSGLAEALAAYARRGGELAGICGGFQMLGRRVTDPHGLEGPPGSESAGLGLLPLDTELRSEKTLIRRDGVHLPSGQVVRGYEIHHGISRSAGAALFDYGSGNHCGLATEDGLVWGSYLHGIFDADGFRHYWLNRLRQRRGLGPLAGPRSSYDLEPALDRLAEILRQHLDMGRIFRLLGH